MNWILLVVALCFGAWAIYIAICAERYDKEYHKPLKGSTTPYRSDHPSWHIDVMAGYYTAVTVIGGIALAMLAIAVI